MNPSEMALVLAKCQTFDNRTVGETNVRAWHEAAGDLPMAMAMRAVTRWYRDNSGWLDPAGLRATARTLWGEDRQQRLDADHDRRLAVADAAPRRDRAGDLAVLLRPKEHNLTLRRRDMAGTSWAWSCTCGQNPTDQDHPDKVAARKAGVRHVPALAGATA